MVCDQSEQRRHQAVADVGAGHLDTNDGLGLVGTEVGGGGVDDAGVDGGAAQANQQEACQGHGLSQGQKHSGNPQGNEADAQADHLGIVPF